MNRRGFFRAALGLAVAPLVPALPAPAGAVIGIDKAIGRDVTGVSIFSGELGRYDGVRIYEGLQWSPEDIDELRKRGASPLVINRVRPAVDAFIAQQREAARLQWA